MPDSVAPTAVEAAEVVEVIQLPSDELGNFDSLAMCDEEPTPE